MNKKAEATDFLGRFREIVSDPLNLIIHRDPDAGMVLDGDVVLHNGIRVPLEGPDAYYGKFSDILVINRGVHEPLEEFLFQEVLKQLTPNPTMLELGAYWGHYSMWCKKAKALASVHLVEASAENLAVGRRNFERNGLVGTFEQGFVGRSQFSVDEYMARCGLHRLNILHADIQGHELEMIEGAESVLSACRAEYVMISTHSQALHLEVIRALGSLGYRIDVSADFDIETTSFDGFILATPHHSNPMFDGFVPPGRAQIAAAPPGLLVERLLACLHR
jgi:hypothetical protein